jgi:hypothetical protein
MKKVAVLLMMYVTVRRAGNGAHQLILTDPVLPAATFDAHANASCVDM